MILLFSRGPLDMDIYGPPTFGGIIYVIEAVPPCPHHVARGMQPRSGGKRAAFSRAPRTLSSLPSSSTTPELADSLARFCPSFRFIGPLRTYGLNYDNYHRTDGKRQPLSSDGATYICIFAQSQARGSGCMPG